MASPDLTLDAAEDLLTEDLVEAGRYPTLTSGSERGLVVLAMRESYWLVPAERDFRLLVEPRILERVRDQLARFERESIGWPPPPLWEGVETHETGVLTPLVWAMAVTVVFRAQDEWPALTAMATMDARAVFDKGEWWRLASALFVHADMAHFMSNILIGMVVFTAVISTFGRSLGWLLVAAAALTGNLMMASANYPAPYRSLGASTAIFAGIGLLTGGAIGRMRHTKHPHRWRAMFGSFAAGLTLLAFYGSGGHLVDVGAHVTGFVAGAVFGLLAGLKRRGTDDQKRKNAGAA